MPKPPSIEQKVLIGLVVGFVQNFVPEFSPADLIWVRALKASKFAVLNVQCKSVVMATRVKSTFASIVKAAVKPHYIGDVSISFAHTVGTRVRLSLMRSISKRQKLNDPNAICSVTAFTSRPLLRVGGKDQGTRFLSFVDSIAGFRHLLTQEDLDKALSLCSGQRGRLKSKYLVLSDDRVLPPYRPKPRNQQGPQVFNQPPPGFVPASTPAAVNQFASLQQVVNLQPAYAGPPVGTQQFVVLQPTIQQQPVPSISGLTPISQSQVTANQVSLPGVVAPGYVTVPQGVMSDWAAQTPPGQHMIAPAQVLQGPTTAAPRPVGSPLNQVLAVAEVHQVPPVQAVRAGRKRGRKTKAPTESKRLTPMRKAKSEKQVPEKIDDPDKPNDQNKSGNQEEYASCASSSEGSDHEDITEVTEVV